MSKDEKKNRSKPKSGALDKFEPGGELGQLDDRNEYEQLLNSLLAEQKELAEESARFADLCQYFSQHKMDIPPSIVESLRKSSRGPAWFMRPARQSLSAPGIRRQPIATTPPAHFLQDAQST